MDPKYIIVQAGGKGSRMESLTRNKPKALVPINNLPMIFHLFRKFPEKKFIVIGDYKYDVLEKYLAAFADVDYKMVNAVGKKGTCSGLATSLTSIPSNESFLLIWCDLVLPDDFKFPDKEANYVGISGDFTCRWSYRNGVFKEQESAEAGVAGYFIFKNKDEISEVPEAGEFVHWLSTSDIKFDIQTLSKTHEYGLYSEWKKIPKMKCRPFNKVEVKKGVFVKTPIDDQGRELAYLEQKWYEKIKSFEDNGGVAIPEIYDVNPLKMQLIKGRNI